MLHSVLVTNVVSVHICITAEKKDTEPPAKLLDDLFRKTKTTPCIYWLPLTEAQVGSCFCTQYGKIIY